MDVALPARFDTEELPIFFNEIDKIVSVDNITLDFSTLNYSMPTGMLVAGSKLRQWIAMRKGAGLATFHKGVNPDKTVQSYLMHLGFFDFIGIPRGNEVGKAKGSSTYLPIRKICRGDFDENQLFDSINEEARKLAGVVAGSFDDSEKLRTYRYSIRELLRNVFEHSQADECYACGQRWQNGRVEFAIIDEGVGICKTLGEKYPLTDDTDALLTAIKPGTSRTYGFSKEQNVFDNSGFGLFVLSQLGQNFGWFCLGSGNARIIGGKEIVSCDGYSFGGTFFGARFNHVPYDFQQVLADIIASGEAEAQVSGIGRRASGKTKIYE